METTIPSYLNIESTRKTVTVALTHQANVSSAHSFSTEHRFRGVNGDLVGVHMDIGPMGITLTTQEALDLATALTEAALFYREKKADALAHYEAMARDAKAGVA